MRGRLISTRRQAALALLLAGALTGGARPAAGQTVADTGAALPAAAVDGNAPPAAGVTRSGSEGRRDPFVRPFLDRGAPAERARPRGLAGMDVDELTLQGLVRIGGSYVAVLESGEGRSHLVRGGETLFDGSVRSVTARGVVIVRRDRSGAPGIDGRTVRLTLSAAREAEP